MPAPKDGTRVAIGITLSLALIFGVVLMFMAALDLLLLAMTGGPGQPAMHPDALGLEGALKVLGGGTILVLLAIAIRRRIRLRGGDTPSI